jgi:hypothetical protein
MSETNGFVTREQLLAPMKRIYKEIEIEGLGKVRIRNISEAERARMEAPNYTKKGTLNLEKLGDARCRLIVAAVVDVDGNPILTNSDVQHLRANDSRIINELSEAIGEHCGISQQDMEDIEKNSPTPAASSQ